jgi:hypothetical protein
MSVGIIVNNLIHNEHLFIGWKKDIIAFVDEPTIELIHINKPILPMLEIIGFNGDLISTNINTTFKMIKAQCGGRKIFYVRELEWTKQEEFYENLLPIYNADIDFVAASEFVADNLKKCWQVKPLNVIPEIEFYRMEKYVG